MRTSKEIEAERVRCFNKLYLHMSYKLSYKQWRKDILWKDPQFLTLTQELREAKRREAKLAEKERLTDHLYQLRRLI